MRILTFFVLTAICLSGCKNEVNTIIDLSGEWQFQVDSTDIGVQGKWFNNKLDDKVNLPGSMTTNGKGYDVSVDTKWTGGIVDSSWYKDEKFAKYRHNLLKLPQRLSQKNRITISPINSQPANGSLLADYFVKIGYQKDADRSVLCPSNVLSNNLAS